MSVRRSILVMNAKKRERYAGIVTDEYKTIEAADDTETLELLASQEREIAAVLVDPAEQRNYLSKLKRLEYMVEYDLLTGFYNKTKFFEATRNMLDAHPDEQFVFIRFDINKFQLINVFYGRAEGDKLLCHFAAEIKKGVKSFSYYTYCRVEADVFACCICYSSNPQIFKLFHHIKSALARYPLSFNIVPDVGVYRLDDLSIPVPEMLDCSALAAKSSKGKGSGTLVWYVQEMSADIASEQQVVNQMTTALEQRQFEVYIQPKYSLSSNLMMSGEALVRWNHPEKGLLPPGDFIPIFEKNGFITRLDYYVWETVCQVLRKWLDAGLNPYPISVNVSRVNLYDAHLVEKICGLIKKYDLPFRLLELELTESTYIDDMDMLAQTVMRLRDKGFTVLMDDFGSGYSSLSVLKDIEVDIIKIDMHFIENGKNKGRGDNILAAVIRMAKWLNTPVVVEGVENEKQVEFLRSIGSEYVQGYYFSKPVPIPEYERLMQKGEVVDFSHTEDPNLSGLWDFNPQMEFLFFHAAQACALYEVTGERIEILLVNQAFRDMFGFVNGVNTYESEVKSFSTMKEAFFSCIRTKVCNSHQFEYKGVGGDLAWIELELQYVGCMGERHILHGSLYDITEQKKMEIELERYRIVETEKQKAGEELPVEDLSAADALDKAFYIIDDETYEMLYMSRGAMEFLDVEHYKGRRCYEILYDVKTPCPFCIRDKLSYDSFYRWSFENPHLKKRMMLQDKWVFYHGRKAHLQIAIDISDVVEDAPIVLL